MPEISVIITTHNRPQELKRAIKSVRNQTYNDYELVIIDDGEDNETKEISKGYKYFKTPYNFGAAKARNYGFEKSGGKYIVFLDDDNEFKPEFLEKSIKLLKLNPEASGIRVGRTILMGNGKYEYEDYAPPFNHTGFESIDWGFLMRREVMEDIKEDEKLYGDEDADFGIRFAQRYKSLAIDEPLTIAHAYDNNSICSPTERRLKGLEHFIKKHLDLYKKDKNELRYLYRLAGRNFYSGGYKIKGIKYFLKSFLAKKSYKSFLHFFFILFGWNIYDWFMDREERRTAIIRLDDFNARRY